MEDQKRGKEIIEAVYKASMQALFAIGVTSPENVEKFTMAFSQAMDREFLKIGLLQSPHNEAQEIPSRVDPGPENSSLPPMHALNTAVDIAVLDLAPLIRHSLRKAGITTVGELMRYLEQHALITLKGIKEKSAKQILEKLNLWYKSTS